MARSQVWLASAALGLVVATATPALALTKVNFSFTAEGTPVRGVFTLDCSPGAGSCTILALDGTFGATPVSKNPDTKPPEPPTPPPVIPDDLLTLPDYAPTNGGFDFWSSGPIYLFLRKEDEDRFLLMLYDAELDERYREYTVTDYQTSVPEPAAWALMLLGFAGVGAAMRTARRSGSSLLRTVRL